jgi:hypothetical protein
MAISPASQKPTSLPAGATTDPPYGPLYNSGYSNPFFYHNFSDDFDNQLGSAGLYTTTSVGGGTVAHTAGDGGLALFTTGATAGNFESIQLPAASFTLPGTGATPPGSSTSIKKVFYLVRFQLSDVTNTAFIGGLCVTTATPFTGVGAARNVADGLFFYKASGGTALQVINIASNGGSPSGTGFTNTFTIPTAAYTLANATNIDLAFYIDRYQNLSMYAGSQLVGWIPQSGTGAVQTAPAGTTILPVLGPALVNYNYQAQAGPSFDPTNAIMFTTLNLNLTLAVGTSAAAAKTMTADFHLAQKER